MMKQLKNFYHRIAGDWLKDVVKEVNCTTTIVCARVDKLWNRAQVDGEDHWFEFDKRKMPSGKALQNNKDSITI